MFDEYCAKIMELVCGAPYGSNESYFTKDGTYMCRVDDYNPYNELEQMKPVIDSLVSALGLRLDSGLMQRAGLLVAARELIWNNMVLDDMIGDSEDILDLSNHSITVENLHDAIDGAYAIGYPIALSARGVTDTQGFIAYNERQFITMAYDMLVSSMDDYINRKQYNEQNI